MKNQTRKIINRYLVDHDMDRGLKELSERTGIKYLSLQRHIKDPGTFRAFEIKAIDEVLHFSDEDLVYLIRQK